jgi:hypothetical protein
MYSTHRVLANHKKCGKNLTPVLKAHIYKNGYDRISPWLYLPYINSIMFVFFSSLSTFTTLTFPLLC